MEGVQVAPSLLCADQPTGREGASQNINGRH